MRHSATRGGLWLAASAALVALMVSLPTHANAQQITLCVGGNGRVTGVNLDSCPSGSTTVTWEQFGPTGPMGATGPAGPQVTGAQGPIGPIGPTGLMGPPGAQGDQGEEGPANLVGGEGGPTGPPGPTGATGPTGAMGPPGATGVTGAKGFDTEDVVVLTGGTLGNVIGAQAGIQLAPGENLTVAMGNGAQQQGHLQAETFVPIPANPNNPTAGVLQDFHFAINPAPGGTGGAYSFSVVDLTHPLPGGSTFICTITDPATTCEDSEQSNPAGHKEILGVNPGDSIAIMVTTADATAPTNVVNVKFSLNYIHDDQI
jgi:hypothetical protein